MNVLNRTFCCPACRKLTRLVLPTDERNCGNCGESLFDFYQEEDFLNTDNPKVIGNWLKVTRTRFYGLSKPASA